MKKKVFVICCFTVCGMLVGYNQRELTNETSVDVIPNEEVEEVFEVQKETVDKPKVLENNKVSKQDENPKVSEGKKAEAVIEKKSDADESKKYVNNKTDLDIQNSTDSSTSKDVISKPEETTDNEPKADEEVSNKEEPVKEEPKEYKIGNSGKLFDSEEEADNEAERMFNDFSDTEKYISRYWIWSTYDKWTIEYEYCYWEEGILN